MLSRLRSDLKALWRRRAFEADMDDELRFHLEARIGDLVRSGLSRSEAERRARLEFGGVERYKERCREARGLRFLDALRDDVAYSLRGLRKNSLLSVAIVLTLTLGIGLNTAVFTMINAIAFRPRVDLDPDTYVHVYSSYTREPGRRMRMGDATLVDYIALRDGAHALSVLAGWRDFRPKLGRDDPQDARGLLVTCNFFSLHGLQRPKLGRLFLPEECSQPGGAPVMVLSEEIWQTRFGADPGIVGKVIEVNRQTLTVVGVTQARFSGRVNRANFWIPYTMQPLLDTRQNLFRSKDAAWLSLAGRLKPGISRLDAEAELRILASHQDRLDPGRTTTLVVTDGSWFGQPEMRQQVNWAISLIMGALTLVLLIACANVTTLLLSRAAARRREIAIRLALGAGRGRLLRLLLTESLMLAGLAGVFSVYIAYQLPPILFIATATEPAEFSLAPDWRVFAYASTAVLLTGLISGLAPAMESLKVEVSASLQGIGSLFGGDARSGSRVRSLLVASQVAMSMVLLAGAGLFARAQYKLVTTDLNFEARQTLFVPIYSQWSGDAAPGSIYAAVAQRVEALPGVQSVAYGRGAPFLGQGTMSVGLPGQPKQLFEQVLVNSVSRGYFETLGIPILEGRGFVEGDVARAAGVSPVVVSGTLARTLWPAENSLGKRLATESGGVLEVAGVARDVVSSMRDADSYGPVVYLPWNREASFHALLVRFSGDPRPVQRAVGAAIREVVPDSVPAVQTIQSRIDEQTAGLWRLGKMVVMLGGIAMTLAVIGIYGVVAFAATRRTKEMGIRIALGAQTQDVVWEMLMSGARPIAGGLLAGLLMAIAAAPVLVKALGRAPFSLTMRDPLTYASVSLLLGLSAFAAMLGPARRAGKADPVETLRHE
jgi:predicted permease